MSFNWSQFELGVPAGCLPLEFWRNHFNLSESELAGGFIVRLGMPTFQLRRCECRSTGDSLNWGF